MRKKLGHWLTGATLHAMGDRYDGVIASVEEQAIRNKFTTKTTLQPVIVFADGKQVVLNRGLQYELIERFGPESDHWVGQTLVVACRRVDRTDAKTGQELVTFEKYLPRADSGRHAEEPTPAWVTDSFAPDGSDPIGAHDEDDIEAEARRVARRRG